MIKDLLFGRYEGVTGLFWATRNLLSSLSTMIISHVDLHNCPIFWPYRIGLYTDSKNIAKDNSDFWIRKILESLGFKIKTHFFAYGI